jgi:hypothetical protein
MRVAEQFVAAKSGQPEQCEDGIVLTSDFAAVIDGGTDKTGLRYDGMTGGRYAMLACADAVRALDPKTDHLGAVQYLTEVLASRLPSDLPGQDRPDAVLNVYSNARREIWQIGDVGFWHAGQPEGGVREHKLIDRYAADTRAAVLRVELAGGGDPVALARTDPGRQAISSLLTNQAKFRNNLAAHEFAYPAIDGGHVPADLVRVHRIPSHVTRLVIASDGYPRILPTLEASEELLAKLLSADPLCLDELRGTKGLVPGNQSFDDRAYLSLAL